MHRQFPVSPPRPRARVPVDAGDAAAGSAAVLRGLGYIGVVEWRVDG